MTLKQFSASIEYASKDAEYSLQYFQNPKTPEANKVLIDLIEHLVWVAVISGVEVELKEAFDSGYKSGLERRNEIELSKKEESKIQDSSE